MALSWTTRSTARWPSPKTKRAARSVGSTIARVAGGVWLGDERGRLGSEHRASGSKPCHFNSNSQPGSSNGSRRTTGIMGSIRTCVQAPASVPLPFTPVRSRVEADHAAVSADHARREGQSDDRRSNRRREARHISRPRYGCGPERRSSRSARNTLL
jgi:hypothetical protein